MRLLPEGISDLDPNLRWIVGESLRLIEDVVCGLQTSGAGAPGMEEAEAAAIVDDMRSDGEGVVAGIHRASTAHRTLPADCPAAGGRWLFRQQPPARLIRRVSGLPRACWSSFRKRASWTPSVRPQRHVGHFWQTNGCLSTANAAQPRCKTTSSSRCPTGPTSTRSCALGRSLMTGASPSPARSPGGWRRLPAGSGGVPPRTPVPSGRPVDPAYPRARHAPSVRH